MPHLGCMSHTALSWNESCHTRASFVCVVLHICCRVIFHLCWVGHVTRMLNEPYPICVRVSPLRKILSESYPPYVYISLTYVEWVMSYTCHTRVERVMAHIHWTRRAAHTLNKSRHTLNRCSCQMNCQAVCRQMLTLGEVVCAWWWFWGGAGWGADRVWSVYVLNKSYHTNIECVMSQICWRGHSTRMMMRISKSPCFWGFSFRLLLTSMLDLFYFHYHQSGRLSFATCKFFFWEFSPNFFGFTINFFFLRVLERTGAWVMW